MGIYMRDENPKAWLEAHAEEVPQGIWSWTLRPEGFIPLICFESRDRAPLVCYFKDEVARAKPRVNDQRLRYYYYAPTVKVLDDLGPGMVEAMKEDIADGFPEDTVFHEDGFPEEYEL